MIKMRYLGFLLMAGMLALLCSGCAPAASKAVTITWLGTPTSLDFSRGMDEDPVGKELIKRTGVKIDWSMNVGVSDTNEKLMVLLASSDLPDVICPINNSAIDQKVIAAKAAIPLDDLVKKHAPNLLKNCMPMINYNKQGKSDETGALYFISSNVGWENVYPDDFDCTWTIRWDLYKKLNYPAISNYDDFLNVLKQMMELEPVNADGKKNYGLGLFLAESWGGVMVDRAMMFEKHLCNSGGAESIYVNTATEKTLPRVTDPDGTFWKSVAFYNRAFRMGVLDPESATLKFSAFQDKFASWRYLACAQQFMNNRKYDDTGEKGFCPIFVEPDPEGVWTNFKYKTGTQVGAYITTKCKNPEKVVKMIDYLATVEACELIYNGLEGTHWQYNASKVPVLIGEQLDAYLNRRDIRNDSGVGKYAGICFYHPPRNPKGYFTDYKYNTEFQYKPVFKDWLTHYNVKSPFEYASKYPNNAWDYVYFTSLNIEVTNDQDLIRLNNNINSYIATNIPAIVFKKTEESFNAEKAKIISELQSMQVDRVMKALGDEYDKLMSRINAK